MVASNLGPGPGDRFFLTIRAVEVKQLGLLESYKNDSREDISETH
jgi:hypothetical protein